MLTKLKEYIETRALLKPSDRLLIGLSGGLDSMVMLHLFQLLPYELNVAHVNFGLRAQESDGDEQFVREYCKMHHLNFHVLNANTANYVAQHKVSVQMAARDIRYNWFNELQKEHHYHKLLVAHHADDSIETTFINLIRGTGISGLKGIISNHNAIRPMLCFNRKEILDYANKNNISWREDSSNVKNDYLRNKLRNNILPLIDEVSDTWRESLLALNTDIEESELLLNSYYEKNIDTIFINNIIYTDKVITVDFGKWMFRKLLISLGFSHDTISDILKNLNIQNGKYYESELAVLTKQIEGYFVKYKNSITINKVDHDIDEQVNEFSINNYLILFNKLNKSDIKNNYKLNEQYVDFAKILFPLKIRNWQAGDWFVPLGMIGRKKLSDYFVDKKFTIQQKENTIVIVSEGNIVCILGHQIDERYKISENTKKIYHLKLTHG